jgi:hypothetical protein
MGLTKKLMEDLDMFDEQHYTSADDVDYQYKLWLANQNQMKENLESESEY